MAAPPMSFSLTAKIAGRDYSLDVTTQGPVNAAKVEVPAGENVPVSITAANPGAPSLTNVEFDFYSYDTPQYQLKFNFGLLPHGTSRFTFTLPAANLRLASQPFIVLAIGPQVYQFIVMLDIRTG
jgi:hypothetical protein